MIKLKDIRERLKVTDQKTEDRVIESMRAAVVQNFELQTARKWAFRTNHVQVLRLNDARQRGGTFWLELYPVTALALVEWDDGVSYYDAAAVDAGWYDLEASIGKVRRVDGDSWWPNVQATITGGYTEDQLAAERPDVREALIQQVLFWFARLQSDKVALASQGFEGGSTSYLEAGFCPMFKMTVETSRRRVR